MLLYDAEEAADAAEQVEARVRVVCIVDVFDAIVDFVDFDELVVPRDGERRRVMVGAVDEEYS